MRERGQTGNRLLAPARSLLRWGFFDRPNGEFSAGVDKGCGARILGAACRKLRPKKLLDLRSLNTRRGLLVRTPGGTTLGRPDVSLRLLARRNGGKTVCRTCLGPLARCGRCCVVAGMPPSGAQHRHRVAQELETWNWGAPPARVRNVSTTGSQYLSTSDADGNTMDEVDNTLRKAQSARFHLRLAPPEPPAAPVRADSAMARVSTGRIARWQQKHRPLSPGWMSASMFQNQMRKCDRKRIAEGSPRNLPALIRRPNGIEGVSGPNVHFAFADCRSCVDVRVEFIDRQNFPIAGST